MFQTLRQGNFITGRRLAALVILSDIGGAKPLRTAERQSWLNHVASLLMLAETLVKWWYRLEQLMHCRFEASAKCELCLQATAPRPD